jgi:hypothetical protein
MQDIYKNPMLYYVLIPVLVALWPLLVWAVYLPGAEQQLETDAGLFYEGRAQIDGILEIDSDRLNFADANDISGEFSYASAVDRVANLCRIPPSDSSYNAGNIIETSGKRRQDAKIKLTDVSITQVAQFFHTLESRWVNLTCEKIKLTKQKGMADRWTADFDFIYYY